MSDKSFPRRAYTVLAVVSNRYSVLIGRFPRVTHPCATLHETEVSLPVRLACVRHAASVRSEPGSNSQVHSGPSGKQVAARSRIRARPIRTFRQEIIKRDGHRWLLHRDPRRRRLLIPSINHNVKERGPKTGRRVLTGPQIEECVSALQRRRSVYLGDFESARQKIAKK